MYSTYETSGTVIQRSHEYVRTAKHEKQNHTHIIQNVCVPELLPYIHTIVTFLNVIYTYTQTSGCIYLIMRAIEATMGFQNTSPEERPCVYAK